MKKVIINMIKIDKRSEQLYCDNCDSLVGYEIIEKKEVYNLRGDLIEINSYVAKCKTCNSELFEPYLENENLKQLYRKYAKKHNLILPEDIKSMREKYDVSQTLFAIILGIGEATIERYESGSLPSESISNLIKSAENPLFFSRMLENNKSKLTKTDYERIKKNIEEIKDFNVNYLSTLEQVYLQTTNSKDLNFQKLYEVVAELFNAIKKLGINFLYKTKFVKLLWLIESSYYDTFGEKLTGLDFAHLPYGPVPERHYILLEIMKEAKIINIEEVDDEPDKAYTILYPNDLSYAKFLEVSEQDFIKQIVGKYGSLNAKELTELTHNDLRWINTKDGELISLEIKE
jgi:putative zinc finger/helix-turn-helix YgiT family protein